MRKYIALLLALVLCISCAACASTNTDEENNASSSVSSYNDQHDGETHESLAASDNEQESPVNDAEGSVAEEETVGQTLLQDFISKAGTMSAQELAESLLANPVIQFSGATTPVEPGLLTGFDNAQIDGFETGVMFAPAISTIPFVGYIFELEPGTNASDFERLLQDNANPRWNICTEAEEAVIYSVDDTVFFLMSPQYFEAE